MPYCRPESDPVAFETGTFICTFYYNYYAKLFLKETSLLELALGSIDCEQYAGYRTSFFLDSFGSGWQYGRWAEKDSTQ